MTNDAGFYKGRGIEGSEQYGTTKKGNDQIAIDLDLSNGNRETTFLVFSDDNAQYSIERLRALGWEGDDLTNLRGIGRNEVDVQIKYETYNGAQQRKVEIRTNGGRVVLKEQMDPRGKRAFAARFKSLATSMRGGSPPTQSNAPAARRQPPPPPPPTDFEPNQDDEIPF